MPLTGLTQTSAFGPRIHPITKQNSFHTGTDLRAYFEPVFSIMDGQVTACGEDKLLGRFIKISHGQIQSIYGHLSEIYVDPGEKILAGHAIGRSGNTGRSTAPHLHFSVKLKEKFIDPLMVLAALKALPNPQTMKPQPIENEQLPLSSLLLLLSENNAIMLSPLQARVYGVSQADLLPKIEEEEDEQ